MNFRNSTVKFSIFDQDSTSYSLAQEPITRIFRLLVHRKKLFVVVTQHNCLFTGELFSREMIHVTVRFSRHFFHARQWHNYTKKAETKRRNVPFLCSISTVRITSFKSNNTKWLNARKTRKPKRIAIKQKVFHSTNGTRTPNCAFSHFDRNLKVHFAATDKNAID